MPPSDVPAELAASAPAKSHQLVPSAAPHGTILEFRFQVLGDCQNSLLDSTDAAARKVYEHGICIVSNQHEAHSMPTAVFQAGIVREKAQEEMHANLVHQNLPFHSDVNNALACITALEVFLGCPEANPACKGDKRRLPFLPCGGPKALLPSLRPSSFHPWRRPSRRLPQCSLAQTSTLLWQAVKYPRKRSGCYLQAQILH